MVSTAKPLYQIALECDVPRLQQPTRRERKTLDLYSVEGNFNGFSVPMSKDPIHCIPHINSRAPFLPEYFNGKFYVVTDAGFGLPEVPGVRVVDDSIGTVEENYIRSRSLIKCGTRTTYYQPGLPYFGFHFVYRELRNALGHLYGEVESKLPALKEFETLEPHIGEFEEQLEHADEASNPEGLLEMAKGMRRDIAKILRRFRNQLRDASQNRRFNELLSSIEGLEAKQFFFNISEGFYNIPPAALFALNPDLPFLQRVSSEEDLEELMHSDDMIELHFPFRSYNFRPKDPTALQEHPNVKRCVHLGTQAVQVVNPQLFSNLGLLGWTITYLCKYHFAAYYLGERERHDIHHKQENSQVRVLDVKKPQRRYMNVASVFPSKTHVREDLHRYFDLLVLSPEWPDDFSLYVATTVPRTY